jgi:hypothetical protein
MPPKCRGPGWTLCFGAANAAKFFHRFRVLDLSLTAM